MAEDQNTALNLEEFSEILESSFADVMSSGRGIAVGVSGGPDSMALLWLLSCWAEKNGGPEIHALIVDHGLRKESAREAKHTLSRINEFPCVTAEVLKWKGRKPESSLQERARRARFSLMNTYCKQHKIRHLFLAHHMDDQAETFLFRLAKGSGLDGLAGMSARQDMDGLMLCRPFLSVPKTRLVATCKKAGLKYISDPSNESRHFARVRLRKSMEILGAEGLTSKRMAVTAKRLRRAREALDMMAQQAYKKAADNENSSRIVLKFSVLKKQPDEIALRVVLQAVSELRPESDYAPRMEKMEALFEDLMAERAFKKRTLGGLVFERDDKKSHVVIQKET